MSLEALNVLRDAGIRAIPIGLSVSIHPNYKINDTGRGFVQHADWKFIL